MLRWIYINDGSFLNGDPFPMGPPRFTDILSSHVIQHEMTHYLARFNNLTYTGPSGSRTYTPDEHITFTGNPPSNILRPSVAAGQSLPLALPGGIATPGTEKAEVFGRISTGSWNNP